MVCLIIFIALHIANIIIFSTIKHYVILGILILKILTTFLKQYRGFIVASEIFLKLFVIKKRCWCS